MKAIILFLLVVARLNFSAEAATNSSVAVDAAAATVPLSPAVDQLRQRTINFASEGYTETADGMARQTTRQLLAPSPDRVATAAEADVMVDAHLTTELYYAFNTKCGTEKERDHRIVYDFLSQLDKSARWTRQQREHFTILTVLSLAAQEYFWNEKSTIGDLQDRVRRELRCGSFKEPGHALNISNAVHLDGEYLERIIGAWVNGKLDGRLKALMDGFKGKTLGTTYADIVVELDTKFVGARQLLPFDNFGQDVLSAFDLGGRMPLLQVTSDGDGMCGEHSLFIPTDGPKDGIVDGNGRYKILRAILDNPTDHVARRLYLHNSEHMEDASFQKIISKYIGELGATDAIGAGELKKKLDDYLALRTRLLAEQEAQKTEFRIKLLKKVRAFPGLRIILANFSQLMRTLDLDTLSKDKDFRYIIDAIKSIGMNEDTGGCIEIKERLATIKDQLDLFDQQIAAKKDELEDACNVAKEKAKAEWLKANCEKKELLKQRTALIGSEGVSDATINEKDAEIKLKEGEGNSKFITYYHMKVDPAALDAFKAEKLAEKYKLITEILLDLVTPELLLGGREAFSDEKLCIDGCGSFVDSICMQICELLIKHKRLDSSDTTKSQLKCFWDEYLLEQEKIGNDIDMERQLLFERFEIVDSLDILPAELAPEALAKEMETLAKKPGELPGWLPCDAIYTQLWAIINNLNVFVFSSGETHGRTPLDLIIRNQQAYDQFSIPYPAGTTGKNLATVILTSPTAKNVFLNKSTVHYDKFIAPGDYAAMARAQRHLEWMKSENASKYAQYPLPTRG